MGISDRQVSTEGMTDSLKNFPWEVSYKTSDIKPDGSSVDILHDFYIPVLRRSVRYDRVAGYFRSSSLAVATQGFSAFTKKGGKIRLVVGCDMAPHDVDMILSGGKPDEDQLAESLNEQLGDESEWPEEVTRGVQLLGWMLQHEHLEIRVAFRVHSTKGEPIAVGSTEDGYVHEKWALFYDEEGKALHIEGSLNESQTALARNAENLSVACEWWSEKHAETVEKGAANFKRIWKDESPALRVMTLPAAVQKRLIKFGDQIKLPVEIDGTTAIPPEVPAPDPLEVLRFAMIGDAPKMPGGRFVGMYTAPAEPWPHQEVVARRLIHSWPYNWMLCDEVGLGKTIESGLALRGLYLSGFAKRILIASPASVSRQWQREMASKFLMPFWLATSVKYESIFPQEKTRWAKTVFEEDLIIVSTALIARTERRKELRGADRFDVALVDEAHYARRSNGQRDNNARVHPKKNRLLQTISESIRPQSRSLWLATATPMQMDPIEVHDLIAVSDRVGAFQFDPSLTESYYQMLGKLVRNATLTNFEWAFLRKAIQTLAYTDPLLWQYLQETVVDPKIKTAVKLWLGKGQIPRGADLKNIRRFVFSAAPLSRVMLRHTRPLLEVYKEKGQLGANLAKRNILPVPAISFTTQEQKAYDQLEVYCNELKAQIERHSSDKGKRIAMGFYLSFLRLRFASSLFAIRETVKRRHKRVIATLHHLEEDQPDSTQVDWGDILEEGEEIDDEEVVRSFLKDRNQKDLEWEIQQLKKMIANLEDLTGTSSKMQELFQVLGKRRDATTGRVEQTVIFSRFFDTVCDIRDRLREADRNILIGTYSGQGSGGQYVDPKTKRLINVDREIVKRKFMQGELDVLICTDAAAEGLNLQSANLLVNFDLPWNPMKVEQRIGRIDRIGQKHTEIYVLNLCYPGSAEEIVYDRLLTRLATAGSVVGQQQVSMLPVTLAEFQELAAKTLSPEDLEAKAMVRLEMQKHREASMQLPPKELYEIYQRLSEDAAAQPLPVSLMEIETAIYGSQHLRDLGCVVEGEGEAQCISMIGLEGIPEGTKLTTSRLLFDEGLPSGEVPRFASYGEPCFTALLDHFSSHELPACIRRVSVEVSELETEFVGYVVATITEAGAETQLFTRVAELEGVILDKDHEIVEEEIAGFRAELQAIVDEELEPVLSAERIERKNVAAAKAQQWLNLMVSSYLITQKSNLSGEDLFWPLVGQFDESLLLRPVINAHLTPLELLQKMKDRLLFDVTAPQMGASGDLDAPRFLMEASIDAACRLADSSHQKKSDCTVPSIVSRIESELKKAVKSM